MGSNRMDLGLYATVVRRHLLICIVGVLLSVGAAVACVHTEDQLRGCATLAITQAGFPWGRSTLDEVVPVRGGTPDLTAPRFADPVRLEHLAQVYAQLASGDAIVKAATRGGVRPVYEVNVLTLYGGHSSSGWSR